MILEAGDFQKRNAVSTQIYLKRTNYKRLFLLFKVGEEKDLRMIWKDESLPKRPTEKKVVKGCQRNRFMCWDNGYLRIEVSRLFL